MDLLVVLLILACAGMNGCTGSSPQAAIGDRLPACEIENLKGGNSKIPDDLDGKVVIIRFWSDCCSYNIHEMEGLDSLYTKYREKGLSVLTIYSGNTREKARQFADELKVPYLVLLDPQMVIAKQYAVTRMPTTFVVDRKGIIREKIIGISEKEAWAQSYEPLIASLL
jgi:peroxiredoxin